MEEQTYAQELANNLREQAQKIRTLLETPSLEVFERDNVSIWRTTYVLDGRAVAAHIVRAQGQPTSGHVTTRHGHAFSTQYVHGHTITAEEIAVFMGLEAVSPDEVEWKRDVRHGKIVVAGVVPDATAAYGPNGQPR